MNENCLRGVDTPPKPAMLLICLPAVHYQIRQSFQAAGPVPHQPTSLTDLERYATHISTFVQLETVELQVQNKTYIHIRVNLTIDL